MAGEQPIPTMTTGPAIWALVVADVERDGAGSELDRLVLADMRARDALGLARYGVRLQAHNGRDALRDAYEEALDLVAYLRQCIEEGRPVAFAYRQALGIVRALRLLMPATAARPPSP